MWWGLRWGGWVHTEKNIGGAIIMNSVIHIPEQFDHCLQPARGSTTTPEGNGAAHNNGIQQSQTYVEYLIQHTDTIQTYYKTEYSTETQTLNTEYNRETLRRAGNTKSKCSDTELKYI